MSSRKAIILRGRMGVGKSSVADEVCRLRQAGPKTVLDDFYETDANQRIRLFAGRPEPVVVYEHGCGEPLDLSFNGFTRGAEAWFDVLRREGREVFLFRPLADLPTIMARMQRDRSAHRLSARLWFNAYRHGDEIVSLPAAIRD